MDKVSRRNPIRVLSFIDTRTSMLNLYFFGLGQIFFRGCAIMIGENFMNSGEVDVIDIYHSLIDRNVETDTAFPFR